MQLSLPFLVLMVLTNCLYNASGQFHAKELVTIDAAYCYLRESFGGGPGTDIVYLFAGDKFVSIKGRIEAFSGKRGSLAVPDDMHLQAAFMPDPNVFEVRYYYGDKYGYYNFFGPNGVVRKLKYGPRRAFLRNGGPDAAGRRNGVVYFFKGCKMAIRHKYRKWEIVSKDVKTIGLPCNVDAAWGETKGAMVILKGNQFWRWEADDSVNGPHAFHDTYRLLSWTLKPSGDTK